MKRLLLAAAALAVTLPAQAAVVTIGFTGTMTYASGDLVAVFGTNAVVGTAITGAVSYNTRDFPAAISCGPNCATWSGFLPGGLIGVTETISGRTFNFAGTYYNGLLLASGPGGSYQYNGSGWVQAFELESADSVSNPVAGAPGWNATTLNLGVLDLSAALVDVSLDPAGPFHLSATQVQSNGGNWATSTAAVQWGFEVDSIDAPEPASAVLLLSGLAIMGLRRRASP